MSDSDSDLTIDYDALTRDALRGVAKKVLIDIEKHGLPGEHHLFISFDTRADGVIISKRLREEYPEEMTIVLQHRFWDLEIHKDHFQVKLTFNAIPERLIIPFKALKVFYDPSVPYGLQFTTSEMKVETIRRSPVLSEVTNSTDVTDLPQYKGEFNQAPLEYLAGKMPELPGDTHAPERDASETMDGSEPHAAEPETGEDADAKEHSEATTAEIVELDHFRKP